MKAMGNSSRSEPGGFLRSRGEKPSPKEAAGLAGIGIDWQAGLDQGRGVHPSLTTMDALAHALRSHTAEHTRVGGATAFYR